MGNTANFEGGTLYALQSALNICGVFEKTKKGPCLPISSLDPMPVLITKSVLRGGIMHSIAAGVMSCYNRDYRPYTMQMTMKRYSKCVVWGKVKQM